MKRLVYLMVTIVILGLIVSGCIPVVPSSEQNELSNTLNKVSIVSEGGEEYINVITNGHKIKNKWDLKGSFVGHSAPYDWDGLAPNATWQYSIHIKEAMDGDYSVGSISFTTGDIKVIGHVKQTKSNYLYWYNNWKPRENLAAAGIAEYDGVTYNFLFLYMDNAMQLALSQAEIEYYWNLDTFWPRSLRLYEFHSIVADETFIWDPKNIH